MPHRHWHPSRADLIPARADDRAPSRSQATSCPSIAPPSKPATGGRHSIAATHQRGRGARQRLVKFRLCCLRALVRVLRCPDVICVRPYATAYVFVRACVAQPVSVEVVSNGGRSRDSDAASSESAITAYQRGCAGQSWARAHEKSACVGSWVLGAFFSFALLA